MLTTNGKLLEFFIHIPKLEVNGLNWVIFKDRFVFAAAAAGWEKHIDGTGTEPSPPAFVTGVPIVLTAEQTTKQELYEGKKLMWLTGEAVIKQAITTTISDSLFIEIQKEVTACLMWEAVRMKREKKLRMVTVDLRRKLQAEKCLEHGDVRAHLNKLQTMREDLASMGGSISDEDFTSIILGSIPPLYDTYIAAISATSSLLNQTLSPTNLIDAICNEADRKAIKNPNAEDVSEDPDDDVPDLMSVSGSSDEGSEMPDLVLVSDSSEGSSDSESDDSADEIGGWFDVPIEMVDETVDCGIKPETRTYSTASASPNREIELYNSGASRHMSPYCQNFINLVRIKGGTLTAADGQEFMATGLGNMHVELPNGKLM
jgi:hypothetical protein